MSSALENIFDTAEKGGDTTAAVENYYTAVGNADNNLLEKHMLRDDFYGTAEKEKERADNQAAQNAMNEDAWKDAGFAAKADDVRYGEKTTDWFDDYTLISGLGNFALPDKPEKVVTMLKAFENIKHSDVPEIQKLFGKVSGDLDVITDDNINSLFYYYGEGEKSGDFTEFNKYWDLVKSDYAEAFYQAGKTLTQDFTDQKGPWGELFAAAISVSNSPKAFGAYVETGVDAITGQEVDTSSPWQMGARATTDYAQISTEDLKGVGKIAADMTIGMVQNAPAIALSIAGFPVIGAAYSAGITFGTDAAQQNLMGVSAGEALLHSTIMGGIDFLMSVIPFESLSIMAKGGMAMALVAKGLNKTLATALTYAVNFGIQAGIGFGETMVTSLVSNLADIAAAGENSRYAQLVRQYMEEDGVSEKAASASAIQELCHEAVIQSVANAAMGGVSSIVATAVGSKRLNQQVQDSIGELANSDGTSPEKKAILNEMSEKLDENPIHIVDETGSRIKQNVGANPEGVKTALIEGMSQLENITTRLTQENGNINYKGIDISAVHDAYVNYFFEGGDLQASAEAMTTGLQEALASGQLTDAETKALDGVLVELVGDVDSAQGVGDNGVIRAGTGKIITEINYKPSSGAELKATPGKTTTILGSFEKDMKNIVEELGNVKTTNVGPNDGGFNVLNVPGELYKGMTRKQFWEKYNRPWLDEAISRGDDIVLATKPEGRVMQSFNKATGEWEPSGFAREYQYLIDNGYNYDSIANKMVK